MVDPDECRGLREIPHCREKVDEEINKVMYASLEKKMVEEILVDSQKLVKEVKKEKVADERLEKPIEVAIAEKQQVEEDQKRKGKDAEVPKAEVKIQTESSETLDKSDHKTEQHYKKCIESGKACTEKYNDLRSRE
ncbi:hypothetical protein Hanom_Chr02g00126951 [Helianthus anomalus]